MARVSLSSLSLSSLGQKYFIEEKWGISYPPLRKKERKKETKKETISAHLTKVVQLRIGTIHANLAIAGCVSGRL